MITCTGTTVTFKNCCCCEIKFCKRFNFLF